MAVCHALSHVVSFLVRSLRRSHKRFKHSSSDQNPGYLLYIGNYTSQLHRDYDNPIRIPMDKSVQRNVIPPGLFHVAHLEVCFIGIVSGRTCCGWQLRMVYTIPVHHNPTGYTMQNWKRQKLMDLARKPVVD